MKMQNVFIGQRYAPQHSAVYTSIGEAVKEIMRPMQEGLCFDITFLPEAPRYWLVAVRDTNVKYPDTRFNLLFTDQDEATKHAEMLKARGWSHNSIIFKELKPVDKGPKNIDIKTEEHFACEQALKVVHDALALGLVVDNDKANVPLTIDNGALQLPEDISVFRISTPAWQQPTEFASAMHAIRSAAALLAEFATVDPETQPRKFARIKEAASAFAGTYNKAPDDV